MTDSTKQSLAKPKSKKLSAEELKAKMFVKLHEDGVFDKFRAFLRSELVHKLHEQEPRNVLGHPLRMKDELEPTFPLDATNWLVSEHLRRNGYDFTLSVFALESGHPSSGRPTLTIGDIVTFMGVHPQSTSGVNIVNGYQNVGDRLFLWKCFLAAPSSPRDPTTVDTLNAAIQTEGDVVGVTSGVLSAQMKLRHLDDSYDFMKRNLRLEDFGPSARQDGPNRLYANPFESNANFPKKFTSHGEEMRQCQMEIDRLRVAVEDQYLLKLRMLAEREKEMGDAMEKQKSLVERDLYHQRQQVLTQAEKFRIQEEEWKMRKESWEKSLKCESERLETAKSQLRDREERLRKSEAHHEQWIREQRHQIEAIERQKYEALEFGLSLKKSELKAASERLATRLATIEEKDQQYEAAKRTISELKLELAQAQFHARQLLEKVAILEQKSIPDHSETAAELRELRGMLRAMSARSESDRREHGSFVGELLSRLTQPSPKILTLETEVERLKRDCQTEKEHFAKQLSFFEKVIMQSEAEKSDLFTKLRNQNQQIAELQKTVEHLGTKSGPSIKESDFHTDMSDVFKLKKDVLESPFAVDTHGTFFDTSFTPGQLPPELKLGAGRHPLVDSLVGQHSDFVTSIPDVSEMETTYDESRARIRMLESEAETLQQKYHSMKTRLEAGRPRLARFIRFEDEPSDWWQQRHSSSRVPSSTPDSSSEGEAGPGVAEAMQDSIDASPIVDPTRFRFWTGAASPPPVSASIANHSQLNVMPESGFDATNITLREPLSRNKEAPLTPAGNLFDHDMPPYRRLNLDLSGDFGLSPVVGGPEFLRPCPELRNLKLFPRHEKAEDGKRGGHLPSLSLRKMETLTGSALDSSSHIKRENSNIPVKGPELKSPQTNADFNKEMTLGAFSKCQENTTLGGIEAACTSKVLAGNLETGVLAADDEASKMRTSADGEDGPASALLSTAVNLDAAWKTAREERESGGGEPDVQRISEDRGGPSTTHDTAPQPSAGITPVNPGALISGRPSGDQSDSALQPTPQTTNERSEPAVLPLQGQADLDEPRSTAQEEQPLYSSEQIQFTSGQEESVTNLPGKSGRVPEEAQRIVRANAIEPPFDPLPLDIDRIDGQISWEKSGAPSPVEDDFEW